jgi:AcrR family transcriptional regulator
MTPPALSQDLRSRLIESAILHFAAKGFDGAGIREIAKSANANSAMVAYHFCGKEGLYTEALQHIFSRKTCHVAHLASLPRAEGPGAREAALQGLRDHIRAFMEDLMNCDRQSPVDEAAMILMAREMQSPRPSSAPLLLEQFQPYIDHLMYCLQTLRPDLSRDALMNMGLSIHGQMLYFRNSLGIVRLFRGNPDYPEDLPGLIQHFTDFSLRGLGIPEAFPEPRN